MSYIAHYDIKHNFILMKSHKVSTAYTARLQMKCGNFIPDDELFKFIKSSPFKVVFFWQFESIVIEKASCMMEYFSYRKIVNYQVIPTGM